MRTRFIRKATLAILLTVPASALSATYTVDTVNELKTRLENAQNGDVIKIDGNGGNNGVYTYTGSTYSIYTTDGWTNLAPMFLINNVRNVTIEALNANKKPLLRGKDYTDKYVFYAQKTDGLTIRNIRFSHARKGVVIDRTNDLTFEKNEISEVGEEAFHLRDGSDNAVIRLNNIHDTGLVKVDRGEAIYICNDRKMWNSYYQPASLQENYQQNCDFAHITGNTIGPNIGNNGVDVKEGTVGVHIDNNTFDLTWTRRELLNSSSNSHPDVVIHFKGTEGVATHNTFDFKDAPASLFRAISVDKQLDRDPALNNIHGFDNWAVNNTIKNAGNGVFAFHASSDGGAKFGCNTGAPNQVPRPKDNRRYTKVLGADCTAPAAPSNRSATPVTNRTATTTPERSSETETNNSNNRSNNTSNNSTNNTNNASNVTFNWENGAEHARYKHVEHSVDNNKLTLELNNNNRDPYVRLHNSVINANDYSHIEIRLKNKTTGTNWKVFFDPSGRAGESGNSVSVNVPRNRSWSTIYVDMTQDADWNGVIDNIRLDMEPYTEGLVEIDYIKPSNGRNSSSSSTGNTQQANTSCVNYTGSRLTEITLNSANCIKVDGGLANKEISIADSDSHSSCDFRATASSQNGNGSRVVNSNWEIISGNWTGNTIKFTNRNNCKYLKLRVRNM